MLSGACASRCDHCGNESVWRNEMLISPETSTASPAHGDMPEQIKSDYEEARNIFDKSPRSSAALLRLSVQKLCVHLGQPGKNLNEDIGELVKQGLPPDIQKALDIVRVIGNNQVHPGVLDVRDDPQTAIAIFELVNMIVADRIARPKQIAELYDKLPAGAKEQIKKRDANSP